MQIWCRMHSVCHDVTVWAVWKTRKKTLCRRLKLCWESLWCTRDVMWIQINKVCPNLIIPFVKIQSRTAMQQFMEEFCHYLSTNRLLLTRASCSAPIYFYFFTQLICHTQILMDRFWIVSDSNLKFWQITVRLSQTKVFAINRTIQFQVTEIFVYHTP